MLQSFNLNSLSVIAIWVIYRPGCKKHIAHSYRTRFIHICEQSQEKVCMYFSNELLISQLSFLRVFFFNVNFLIPILIYLLCDFYNNWMYIKVGKNGVWKMVLILGLDFGMFQHKRQSKDIKLSDNI